MKFSIIICTHNSAERLPKTLDSILSQKFDDYEIIIIDGASTDGTQEVIKNFENKFSEKIRWTSEPDSGIYNAMNKGIQLANGEFLNFIGAGDWQEKDALEKAFECIKNNSEADAVYGKTRIWDKHLKNSRVAQMLPEILPIQPMQHPALFYKKSLHDKFGLYDEKYSIVSDYAFCLRAFYQGKATLQPFDAVVDNFIMDGLSSKKQFLCFRENISARKEAGIKVNIIFEFLNYLKSRLKS